MEQNKLIISTQQNLEAYLTTFSENSEITSETAMSELLDMDLNKISSLVVKTDEGKYDRSLAYAYMAVIVTKLDGYFGSDWSNDQVKDVSKMLYDEFSYLRNENWLHFYKKATRMDFGKMFGKFTPAILIEWVNQYASDWQQANALRSANKGQIKYSQKLSEVIKEVKMINNK